MSLFRGVIDALLPPGSLWVPDSGYDLDLLLDGISDNIDTVRVFLHELARVRSPLLTPILADLEREYGIVPNDKLSESVRRQRLLAVKTDGNSDGTTDWLQNKLRAAGFDVYVHINNPAVDPATLLNYGNDPVFASDEEGAQFGESGEYFVAKGGVLLVNGPIYYNQELITYQSPSASQYWPLIFFIGGPATRDTDGSLLDFEWVKIDILRKTEFIRLIIKYKPMFTWVGVKADYVTSFSSSSGGGMGWLPRPTGVTIIT